MKYLTLAVFLIFTCFSCTPVTDLHAIEEFDGTSDSINKPKLALPDREIIRLCTIDDSTLQSGLVLVRTIVQKDGKLTDFAIEKGIGALEDSAALKKVRSLPDFVPGRLKGQTVKVLNYLPILIKGHAVDTTSKR